MFVNELVKSMEDINIKEVPENKNLRKIAI